MEPACTIVDWVTLGKEVVLAAAGLVTAVIAAKGLSTWRSQLQGTSHFEAAREMARATYRLRDCIADFRSPWIPAEEYPDGHRINATACEKADALAHVYEARWKPLAHAMLAFNDATLEVAAVLGPDLNGRAESLRKAIAQLRHFLRSYLRDLARGGMDAQGGLSPEIRRRVLLTLYAPIGRAQQGDDGADEDAFGKLIDDEVDQIERFLLPALGRGARAAPEYSLPLSRILRRLRVGLSSSIR